jgi:hypothetical protein
MSASLVAVLITLLKGASTPTPTGAASAGTSVVVTDSSGVAQNPVVLTGNESPPWSFTTSVAPGSGQVVATDLDANGATLGSPVSQSFTEAGSGPGGNNFLPTTSITVAPATPGTPVAQPALRRA